MNKLILRIEITIAVNILESMMFRIEGDDNVVFSLGGIELLTGSCLVDEADELGDFDDLSGSTEVEDARVCDFGSDFIWESICLFVWFIDWDEASFKVDTSLILLVGGGSFVCDILILSESEAVTLEWMSFDDADFDICDFGSIDFVGDKSYIWSLELFGAALELGVTHKGDLWMVEESGICFDLDSATAWRTRAEDRREEQ